MTLRRRFLALAIGWVVLVAAFILAAMLAVRDRLPEPLATHWGVDGRPDGTMPFAVATAFFVGLWLLIATIALAAFTGGGLLMQRNQRAWLGGLLAGTGAFFAVLLAVTIDANLDRADWRAAGSVGFGHVALALAAAAVVAALGSMLARHGPHVEPSKDRAAPRPLRVTADEHAVWVSRVTNRFLIGLSVALVLVAVVLAAVSVLALPRWLLFAVALPLAAVALAGWSVSTIRVEVNRHGLTVGYGRWAWPRRRTPLREIVEVWTEHRTPGQVGGWGYRGLPGGNSTLMIRSGPCLVIRRRAGSEFAVSADDAEHGAALLDALRRLPVR